MTEQDDEPIDHADMLVHGALIVAIAGSGIIAGKGFVSHFTEQFGLTGVDGLVFMALIGLISLAIVYGIGRFGRWLDD